LESRSIEFLSFAVVASIRPAYGMPIAIYFLRPGLIFRPSTIDIPIRLGFEVGRDRMDAGNVTHL
jgi:hypothetical protein